MKNKLIYICLSAVVSFTSCTTSDLDPTLAQEKQLEGSISSTEDLAGVLRGAYSRMTVRQYYGRDFIIHNEVRTDNVFANGNSGRFQTPATFNYTADGNPGIWTHAYRVIASANIILGTDVSSFDETTSDISEAKHIQGQAYAIRALAHFDLLRNYGQQHVGGTLGIPYVTEFRGDNLTPSRNTIEEVKKFIFEDLNMAFNTMSDAHYDSSKETMSKYTAKAIESKVALYFGMYNEAKAAAELVINSGLYSIVPKDNYVNSFAIDAAQNSIFELAYSDIDNLDSNSLGFIYKGDVYGDIEVLENVSNLYEAGDVRADILGMEDERLRNLGKYPALNGYDNVPIIRFEEVILNYAEALFETGGDALTQINLLTAERGASAYTAPLTKDDILNERRKELIFEGFRYDDLLRTQKNIEKIDPKQNISQSIPYGDHRMAMPIPQVELDANSNMDQNKGY
ncbi:RagB/SusD family nutrient uptake outer membrane protein [Aquimarina hainanensis]|uniref:RagB/SusD family nutrient uptake outer membrane protein n=1 Tax=Aquimarina hainanensis TaxID=1578017 RepID=A0ABW5NAR2_9FLAO